ncbi:MAG: hypothetical protein KDB88_13085 [Flavobacteriales bacterium]|nr:hypothetical protein [Flavobacteriales bacterium]
MKDRYMMDEKRAVRSGIIDRATMSFLILLALVLLGMTVHRAYVASFTHDESFSYLFYIDAGYSELLRGDLTYSNNHILNTVGMKLSSALFGTSELALRAPNLFALAIYLAVCVALLLRSRWMIALPVGMLLMTNPFLLELFSLARGYGLLTGFLALALFAFQSALRSQHKGALLAGHISGLLACLSNFAGVPAYLSLSIGFFLLEHRWRPGWRPVHWLHGMLLRIHMVAFVLVMAVLYRPLSLSLASNTYDFGEQYGVWDGTIRTWSLSLFSYRSGWEGYLVYPSIAFAMVLVIAGIWLIRQAISDPPDDRSTPRTASALPILMVLGTLAIVELKHIISGTDLLKGRFAMFLFPFVLFSLLALMGGTRSTLMRALSASIVLIGGLTSGVSFFSGFGPKSSVEWRYDVNTKEVMLLLEQEHQALPTDTSRLHVGISWVFEPTMNFYRQTMGLGRIAPFDRSGFSPTDEMRYELTTMGHSDMAGYTLVKDFPESASRLWRKEEPGSY